MTHSLFTVWTFVYNEEEEAGFRQVDDGAPHPKVRGNGFASPIVAPG
jgi:hypothetical protein